MKTIVVICGLVLFSWPIAVIVWRYLNRPRPQGTTDPYRAGPPPAPPEPPWFVRWWDWANTSTVPMDWLRRNERNGRWIAGILTGVVTSVIVLSNVKFEKTETKALEVATAKAAQTRGGFNCVWGWWVPDNPQYNYDTLTMTSIGTPSEPSALVCGTKGRGIECFETWKCP